MFDRKVYDRERARKLYKEFQERRNNILIKLGNECYLCSRKAEKGFHLHHVEYDEVESAYPTHSKSMHVRLKRLNEAEVNPHRFKLLCPKCHFLITKIEGLLKNVNHEKLLKLIG